MAVPESTVWDRDPHAEAKHLVLRGYFDAWYPIMLRTFPHLRRRLGHNPGGPAQDSEVLAVLIWKQAFVFLDSPQAGMATALAILMSIVLIAGAWPYLRHLTEDSR